MRLQVSCAQMVTWWGGRKVFSFRRRGKSTTGFDLMDFYIEGMETVDSEVCWNHHQRWEKRCVGGSVIYCRPWLTCWLCSVRFKDPITDKGKADRKQQGWNADDANMSWKHTDAQQQLHTYSSGKAMPSLHLILPHPPHHHQLFHPQTYAS